MFEFLAFLALIILFVLLMDARSRLKRAEATLQEAAKRIGALQRHAGLLPPKAGEAPLPEAPREPIAEPAPEGQRVMQQCRMLRNVFMGGTNTPARRCRQEETAMPAEGAPGFDDPDRTI